MATEVDAFVTFPNEREILDSAIHDPRAHGIRVDPYPHSSNPELDLCGIREVARPTRLYKLG